MNVQPTGTVTLLFSDLEGSTRLLHRLGRDVYAGALEAHREILHEACARHGGYEVDVEGDSMFLAFWTAGDAVAAAGEAQRALASQEWPEDQAFRVRMGIHTGQPLAAPPKYVGLDVHRAARIMAVGHGGQVLMSDATERLLAADERGLKGLSLADLGEWRLKDFDRPVRLYQLRGEGLQGVFPPVRAERVAPARRLRPAVIAASVVAVATVAAAFIFSRGGGQRLDASPNSLSVVDADHDKPIAAVPIGVQPGPVAFGAGAALVANLADRTLSWIDPETNTVTRTIPLGEIASDVAADPTGWALVYGHPLRVALLAANADTPSTTVAYHQACEGCSASMKHDVTKGDNELDAGGVAFGAGSVWAVGSHAAFNPDSVLIRVNPASGRIVASHDWEADTATGVAVGNGAVWIAARGDNSVWEISTRTTDVVAKVTVGKEPSDVAFGDGSVWVTTLGDDSLWRLDVREGEAPTVDRVISVGSQPSAVVVSPDAVWVANRGDGTISRVDPDSDKVVATIPVGSAPTGIAFGAGRVWTTVQASQQ